MFLDYTNIEQERSFLENMNVCGISEQFNIYTISETSSIAIVGNGQISHNCGNIIDSNHTVVRFNGFRIHGFESIVGQSTTFHIINSQNTSLISNKSPYFYILIDTSVPKLMYDFYFENIKKYPNILIIKPSYYTVLGNLLNLRYKTQGYFFIEIIKTIYDTVNLFGFWGDTHYFNNNWKMYSAHPLNIEHENYKLWETDKFIIHP